MMAYFMGMADINFFDALFHDKGIIIPFLIGLIILCSGFVFLLFPKISYSIQIKTDEYKEKE